MVFAHAHDSWPIHSAPFDDLDLDREADDEEWERRVMALAAFRVQAARERLCWSWPDRPAAARRRSERPPR
jgi:hypothetical protein